MKSTNQDLSGLPTEERYTQLLRAMDDGFCVCEMLFDPQGNPSDYRFLEVNPNFERHTGLLNAVGKTLLELLPGETQWIKAYHPVVLQRETVRFEDRSEKLERQFEVYAFPMGPPERHTFAIIFRDISERVKAFQMVETKNRELNQALREAHQLTALVDNSPDFIGLANSEGQPVYLNPAGKKMVGLENQSMKDLHITDFFQPEDIAYVQETIIPTVEREGYWVDEYRFRHFRTGDTIPVWYNLFAIKDPDDGKLLGRATITINITERKQREAELQEYRERLALTNEELATANEELIVTNDDLSRINKRLMQVNTDLDNFVYTASHDLKSPISNITGLLEILKQNLSSESLSSERTQKVLRMMSGSIARFMNTISEMSDIARLQKQANQPSEEVPLATIIEEVRQDLVLLIEEANMRLDIRTEACETVQFAPKNLRSVVYNLLSNAIKYRDPARPLQVIVRCEPAEDYQVLTVQDNGLGMDLSGNHRLFGLFQRLHDHVEGTGIGLYIVKKVVENAGGKIEVDSQVGVGTTFRIYFKRNG